MRSGNHRADALDNVRYDVYYGIVTQNKDPDGLNRIKVRLPWMDAGETDQTHWAQLLTPMEGDKFGWYTLPDIDDVVVLVFVDGDSKQPVIVGGIWSKTDNSPETNEDGKNNFRGYRSRSGHRLILDDSSKTKVVLADKTAKNMIGIGQFDKDGAGPNVCAVYKPPMSGTCGISVSTMEGKMELTCKDGKLSIEAQGEVKINATTSINIKASKDFSLEGQSNTKLTSGTPCSYDASSIEIA